MISRTLRFTVSAFVLAVSTLAHAQLTMRDDLGRTVVVKKPATRIVTLAPFLTEIAFAAGAGDLVVGVDSMSEYPPEVRSLEQVKTGAQFVLDQIALIKPDLVLAWRDGIRREDVDAMAAFGAVVFVAQARQLEDVPRLMTAVATLTGRSALASTTAFNQRLEHLRRENAAKPRVSAFLEIWNRPLTTVTGAHFLTQALEICRGENVFRHLTGLAPRVSWDEVQELNPYVIVGAGSAANAEEFRANWVLRQQLSAVKSDRLVFVDADTIMRPTPRTPEGIQQLCAGLDRARGTVTAMSPLPPAPQPAPRGSVATPAPGPTAAAPATPAPTPPAAQPIPSGQRPSQFGL
jgi:iron complex transport system substrate-binding protein